MTDWSDAQCLGMDDSAFLFDTGDSRAPRAVREKVAAAKAVCAACPAAGRCLEAELDAMCEWGGVTFGIRGGTDERERRRMVRARLGFMPTSPREHGTDAGYNQHLRYGDDACAGCVDAHAREWQDWKGRKAQRMADSGVMRQLRATVYAESLALRDVRDQEDSMMRKPTVSDIERMATAGPDETKPHSATRKPFVMLVRRGADELRRRLDHGALHAGRVRRGCPLPTRPGLPLCDRTGHPLFEVQSRQRFSHLFTAVDSRRSRRGAAVHRLATTPSSKHCNPRSSTRRSQLTPSSPCSIVPATDR